MLLTWILFLAILSFHSLVLAASHNTRPTYDYNHKADIKFVFHKRDIDQNKTRDALVEPIPYNGSIPLRLEFREFQKDYEAWNLYLLALSWMQWANQSDPASWYAIAGIHGAPFADYGGVKALPGLKSNGYCTHVSVLFPPWHRPYLALYEQTISGIVKMIAAWYPDGRRSAFQKAAEDFRIPYWDWAMKPPNGTSVFPLAVGGSSEVEVDGPNGKQNISNPLFSYTFKPLDPDIFEEYPFMYWTETKRRPTPMQAINATSDNGWVAQNFDKDLPNIQQRLYALFANSGNYSNWSNEAWIPDGSNSSLDSIESLHDTVHLTSGGNFGHMSIIAYSSFDPVFFLHHANVDRLFAMWQVVYNESWIEPTKAILPTRTISAGDNQTSLTDLTPFFYNETHFWNSDQVRDHKIFGYSYADVVGGNRSEVIAAINRLYTDYSPATMHFLTKRDSSTKIGTASTHMGRQGFMESIVRNGTYQEYTANIRVNKFTLGASFSIHFFFGEIPLFPENWELASTKIGSFGVFAGGHAHGMEALHIGGTVPLTSALVDLVSVGRLSNLETEVVEPYLRENLRFTVMHINGTAVDPNAVDNLHISVVCSAVQTPYTNTELASWDGTKTLFTIH
ncbi:common central domain of tyrosinase-domain-containing protein [Truncatella angustata]|uniref:Common central domain of tyrosinase-domain-containing protein n=1 Tax=Truncatella angustata TaxID=152316 RepID=A0A9P9A454_9PEZI|nr:common central domain of tyrosinase-domain-containing protein [Truncatella angustata]KAH6659945.1 common central domain of tyrosinase-domain-containing protein [Truncatella angustata]